MEEFVDLLLSEFTSNLVLSIVFSISFLSHLQLLSKNLISVAGKRLPALILNNMTYWCVASVFGAIKAGYSLVPVTERNGAFSSFITGQFIGITLSISISITFLLLDRVFAFLLPLKYRKLKKFFIGSTLFLCLIASLLVFASLHLNFSIFTKENFGCQSNCKQALTINFLIFLRTIFGIVNTLFSVFLIVILKTYTTPGQSQNRQYKRANQITVIAALIEFICNFIPNLFYILSKFLQYEISQRANTYPAYLIGLDSLLTALSYRYLIRSKKERINRVQSNNTTVPSRIVDPN